MNFDELEESLFLLPRHTCCDNAEFHLIPPHRGCKRTKVDIGSAIIGQSSSWDLAVSGVHLDVNFCPWCGADLYLIPEVQFKVVDKASPAIAEAAHSLAMLAIDVMPAGPKLDSLIAEIMGCTINWYHWHNPDGPYLPLCGCKRKHPKSLKPHEGKQNHLKRYSADITAALTVIDWLDELHGAWVEIKGPRVWLVRFHLPGGKQFSATAPTLALAIGRAALKTVKEQGDAD